MPTDRSDARPPRLTPLQWLIVVIAAIGFAFDSYELLMLPLIVRPALSELLQVPSTSPLINDWADSGMEGLGYRFWCGASRSSSSKKCSTTTSGSFDASSLIIKNR